MKNVCSRCEKPNTELHKFVVPVVPYDEKAGIMQSMLEGMFGPQEVEVNICQSCVSWMMRNSVRGK
ncbi:MAG: hypothetical protein U9N61_11235 [Euryarchaeota archaeon]|nr:hypothetical protein [Euryarchaeota archaeon]